VGLTGITTGQLGQFPLPRLGVPQVGHPRQRAAVLHLLAHLEVVVGGGRNQGLVGDAEHLALLGQAPQQRRDRAAHPAADAGVDFIEEQGDVGIGRRQAGGERQQEAAHLATGGHLLQRGQGLAGVGREQELDQIGAVIFWCDGLQRHAEAHIGEAKRSE